MRRPLRRRVGFGQLAQLAAIDKGLQDILLDVEVRNVAPRCGSNSDYTHGLVISRGSTKHLHKNKI